jgi:hypothetical protein
VYKYLYLCVYVYRSVRQSRLEQKSGSNVIHSPDTPVEASEGNFYIIRYIYIYATIYIYVNKYMYMYIYI